jgi:glycosyltransferase involved in cell wall biosynthesis
MKPKLLLATESYLPRKDGISRFLSLLVEPLKSSFKQTVVAPDFGKPPITKDVNIVQLPLWKVRFGDIYFSKPNRKRIRKLVKESDMVFSQSIGPIGGLAILAAKKYRKPRVAFLHNIEWELASKSIKRFKRLCKWIVKTWAKYVYNRCDLLIAPSRKVEAIFREIGVKTRIEIVSLGIDTDVFKPIKNKSAAKKKLKLTGPVIGFCGRIGREKNLETLYKSFKQVQKRVKDAKLLIVGEGLAERFLKDKAVIAVGSQDNVVPYLQAMDVFVMPSLIETSSLATMEAMSCGLPVIASEVGNIPEYVKEGYNGMLFDALDVKQLSTKIDVLLHNEGIRKQIGENARKTICKEHQLSKQAKKIKESLVKLYK